MAGDLDFALFTLPPRRTNAFPSNWILIPPLLLGTKFTHLNHVPGCLQLLTEAKVLAIASLAQAGPEEGMAPI